LIGTALLAVAGLLAPCVAQAAAEEACGLCNTEVVTNSELASCFLDEYAGLAAKDGAVIVVDLSNCSTSRGGLEALPLPSNNGPELEPDMQFMLSRGQLDCLKAKLEEPGLVLDPAARIELSSCG